MLDFITLRAENALSYQDLEVPLANQGLVLIDGPNGGGKSSIFEILTHACFGVTSKRKVRDNAMPNRYLVDRRGNPTGMHIQVDFNKLGVPYQVNQYRNHPEHGTSMHLDKDGTSIRAKKNKSINKDTQSRVIQELGMTAQEFFGSIYLSQQFTHAMIHGKPSDKKDYVLRYFGLEQFDQVIDNVKVSLDATPSVAMDSYDDLIATLQDDLQQQKALANQVDVQELYQRRRDLKARVAKTRQELIEFDSAKHQLDVYMQRKVRYDAHPRSGENIDPQAMVESLTQQRYVLKEKLETAKAYEKISTQLHAIPLVTKEQFLEATETHAALTKQLEDYRADKPKLKEIANLDEQLKQFEDDEPIWSSKLEGRLVVLTEMVADFRADVRQLEGELAKLQSLGDVCIQCQRPVTAEEQVLWVQDKEAAIKASNTALRKSQTKADDLRQLKKEYDKYTQLTTRRDELVGDLRLPLGTQGPSKDQVAEVNKTISNFTSRKELLSNLPEDPGRSPSAFILELEDVQEKLGQYKELSRLKADLIDKPEYDPDAHETALDANTNDQAKLEDVLSQISKAEVHADMIESTEAKLAKVEQDRRAAGDKARIRKVRQTLHLSLKDLKNLKLHNAIKILVGLLPNYIDLLFPNEQVKVDVPDSEDGVDLVFSKAGSIIPLDSLSGGQGRKLGLAIIFAFSHLQHRPCNIMIADEPYNNLDPRSRKACFDLIKDLQDTRNLSSIFVMSHEQDLRAQRYDQRWSVRYDGRLSTLIRE